MKFLKPLLFTSVLLAACASVIIYSSSCSQATCTDVTCHNGGSCNNGVCKCPTGYEGANCDSLVANRYLGTYAGFTSCNNSAETIDSVTISKDNPRNILSVKVVEKAHPFDTLHGFVTSNETTYELTLNDITYTNYHKTFNITLQSNNVLTLYSYEQDYTNPADTVINSCSFRGTKD